MSSTGQTFVKSFARASQSNSTGKRTARTAQPNVDPSVNPPTNTHSTAPHSATVDSAAAKPTQQKTEELWIDSFDDTDHRLDQAPALVPSPHFPPGSLQHTHTAYDAAAYLSADEIVDVQPVESPEAILAARVAKLLQPSEPKQPTVSQTVQAEPETQATHQHPGLESVQAQQQTAQKQSVQDSLASSNAAEISSRQGETLRANWEVEVFDIPQPVADLFFEEPLFQELSDRMQEAACGGLRTMMMTSALPGEGRTTVAIGIALAAASSGLRVALVDGDLAQPTLAEELRLDLDHSWVENVRRGLPMKEIAVHAIEDNLTLIPLLPTDSGRQATAVECAQMIESLKPSFDLIIVDGPTADARDIKMLGTAIDSVIIVHDVNQSGEAAADLLAARMQRVGIDGVGIVENFV
jgi:Mrp family chromosome partitioning ATPase